MVPRGNVGREVFAARKRDRSEAAETASSETRGSLRTENAPGRRMSGAGESMGFLFEDFQRKLLPSNGSARDTLVRQRQLIRKAGRTSIPADGTPFRPCVFVFYRMLSTMHRARSPSVHVARKTEVPSPFRSMGWLFLRFFTACSLPCAAWRPVKLRGRRRWRRRIRRPSTRREKRRCRRPSEARAGRSRPRFPRGRTRYSRR